MIEILHPGWPSLIVDGGRFGAAAVGVPSSSALDLYALRALQCLTGQQPDAPALEIIGPSFALKFHCAVTCAVTGARVRATLNDTPIRPWSTFRAGADDVLRIREVTEGLRYYIGFAAKLALERVMGSYATNAECGFGGYRGRLLKARDRLELTEITDVRRGIFPEGEIPRMHPPHRLRVVEGPESTFFTAESCEKFMGRQGHVVYDVSVQSNRTGIRLEGEPLSFRWTAERSIISEGILPGTVQVPGDGQPIVMLHERTVGGYARMAVVIKADHDCLAHLKPGDQVLFEKVGLDTARGLWEMRQQKTDALAAVIQRPD